YFVPIYPIKWVGLVSSAGIFCVYILIMFFFCAILSFGTDTKPEKIISDKNNDDFYERMGNFFTRNGKKTIPIATLIIAISIFGATKVYVNLNTNKMMGTKLPHTKDQLHISQTEIGFTYSYDVAILFKDKNQALNIETMEKIDELSEFIEAYPFIKNVRGITGSLKEFNRIMNNDIESQYKLPETNAKLRGLVNLYSRMQGSDLSSWLNKDKTGLRITVQVTEFSSADLSKHVAEVENEIEQLFPETQYPGREVLLSGSVIQTAAMNQYVTKGLIVSVGTALAAIALILIIAFRSIKLGLIAMIPNITPVILVGGIMGFAGIELEFVTMTIAPMLLGLAVDDTIHLITHIKTVFTRSGSYKTALSETFRAVGKSVVQTTFILSVTFFIFIFSRVHSMVNMGLLTMVGVITALAADLIITPVLVKWTKPFGKEKTPANIN
ncbi:MAG: MMPL family transporter, partial [Spirochaetales bacterium]|nr:MMPL family transporter [Spirochaetales bacterium]